MNNREPMLMMKNRLSYFFLSLHFSFSFSLHILARIAWNFPLHSVSFLLKCPFFQVGLFFHRFYEPRLCYSQKLITNFSHLPLLLWKRHKNKVSNVGGHCKLLCCIHNCFYAALFSCSLVWDSWIVHLDTFTARTSIFQLIGPTSTTAHFFYLASFHEIQCCHVNGGGSRLGFISQSSHLRLPLFVRRVSSSSFSSWTPLCS